MKIVLLKFNSAKYTKLTKERENVSAIKESFSPTFIINGGEDNVTPAKNAVELYKNLTGNGISVEMHIYGKGGHGFDSGIGRGNGISTWRDSFVAWLKDAGF